MFIVKGIVLGLTMFAAFTFVLSLGMGNSALGQNTLYWTAGALMLALGCVIMAIRPVKVLP